MEKRMSRKRSRAEITTTIPDANKPSSDVMNKPNYHPLLCGTLSGIATAGLFNPVDRALYLSVINLKPFLHSDNWKQPFQGASNALLHRTISGGLYFAAYDLIEQPVKSWSVQRSFLQDSRYDIVVTSFITGTAAGFVNGVVLNPIAAVKYAAWGADTSKGLQSFAVSLWVSFFLNIFSFFLIF
jgi:hypothetical protein